jgi:hypothetical protein
MESAQFRSGNDQHNLKIRWYLQERRVTNDCSTYRTIEGKIENISAAQAVANCTKRCYTLMLECRNDFIDWWAGLSGAMAPEPAP